MNDTITLEEFETLAGPTRKWERGAHVRHYANIPGAKYTTWWSQGKVYFRVDRGVSTTAANATAAAVIGCNMIDAWRDAAPYVVVVR